MKQLRIIVGTGYVTLLIAAFVLEDYLITALITLIIIDNIIYNLERN